MEKGVSLFFVKVTTNRSVMWHYVLYTSKRLEKCDVSDQGFNFVYPQLESAKILKCISGKTIAEFQNRNSRERKKSREKATKLLEQF